MAPESSIMQHDEATKILTLWYVVLIPQILICRKNCAQSTLCCISGCSKTAKIVCFKYKHKTHALAYTFKAGSWADLHVLAHIFMLITYNIWLLLNSASRCICGEIDNDNRKHVIKGASTLSRVNFAGYVAIFSWSLHCCMLFSSMV